MRYIVTKHARNRFTQRFRLMFNPAYFSSTSTIDSLIESLVKRSHRITWWENIPFYKNKVESVYGPISALQAPGSGDMIFIALQKHVDTVVIKTVVPSFNPRYPLNG